MRSKSPYKLEVQKPEIIGMSYQNRNIGNFLVLERPKYHLNHRQKRKRDLKADSGKLIVKAKVNCSKQINSFPKRKGAL